jgi:outer membrane lipoprotein-sorting protein
MKFFLILALCSFKIFAQVNFIPQTVTVEFEESYTSSISKKVKKSFGKLDYKFPGHLRFEKISPDKLSFVCNPKTSWYYTPAVVKGESGQVIIQSSSGFVVSKFLDSLRSGMKTNKDYEVVKQEKSVVLTFKNKKDIELKEAVLHSMRKIDETKSIADLAMIDLLYLDNRKISLRLLSIKENTVFSEGYFNFVIPEKTKIVDKRK